MELNFVGEEEVPRPPQETRFRSVWAEPLGDRRRVHIEFELTPFQRRPDIEIEVRDASGQQVASTSIIENVDVRAGLTLHLRGEVPLGSYQALLTMTYPELGRTDERALTFEIT